MIDLLIIAVLSVMAALLALLASGPLRVALGVLFVLFFPGYALIAALFPRKGVIDGIERIALSFGLSIAVVPLIGLVLNYTPWGIKLEPIAISLLCFTLAMTGTAVIRRRQLPMEERFVVPFREFFDKLTLGWRAGGPWDRALTVLLLLAIAGAIGATAYLVQSSKQGEKFTEFYILGPGGKAEDYPRNLLIGEKGTVILGIVNREQEPMTYRADIEIDGEKVEEVGPLTLENEEKWEQSVSFAPVKSGTGQKVEFLLFKDTDPEPDQDLHLWIDVSEVP